MSDRPVPTQVDLEELIGELAEQFAQRLRSGERPDVEEYARHYPEAADALRQILPALEIMAAAPAVVEGDHFAGRTDGSHGALGDFRISRELGRGGMGVVYEAEQISLGRRMALKVLPFAAMLDKQQLKRFKNEARAAATLDHPNIVAVHSVGEERGVHYYAMQLVEGQSLAQVIEELRRTRGIPANKGDADGVATIAFAANGATPATSNVSDISLAADTRRELQAGVSTIPAFDSREYFRMAARLGVQAAEALDHAHQNGILHRDVKPANLMVDDAGKLWVTDFGLARMEADAGMTMTGDILGTLRYMSPEQALAKRVVVDHRSDVYSLGVTLYELLTLEPIYEGNDRQELLRQIAFEEPRPPRRVNARIPQDLETIVLKAIEKNPNDRYTTAQLLADDLKRFLDDEPIQAQPPSLLNRASKWSRRHRALMASAGSSAIAFAALSIAVLAYSNVAITRERNETASALAREIKLRRELEVREKITRIAGFYSQNKSEAESLLNSIPEHDLPPTFQHADFRLALVQRHMLHERWDQAADNGDVYWRIDPSYDDDESGSYLIIGPTYALSADLTRYEDFRNALLVRFQNTKDAVLAERTSRLCLLRSADEAFLGQLHPLYLRLLEAQENPDQVYGILKSGRGREFQIWGSLALGIIDYRCGRFRTATERLDEVINNTSVAPRFTGRLAIAYAMRAMSYHQLGMENEAQMSLATAHIFNDAADLGVAAHDEDALSGTTQGESIVPLYDGLFGHLAVSEADAVIDSPHATRMGSYPPGQTFVGNCYARGLLGPVNYAESVKWYLKAAEQGYAPAQVNLLWRYLEGRGVAVDHAEAAKLATRATDQFEWTCSLTAEAARDLISPLCTEEVRTAIENHRPHAVNLATIGAVHYRAAQYTQAAFQLEEAVAAFDEEAAPPANKLFAQLLLSMAKRQLGHETEALQLLAKTQDALEKLVEDNPSDWERLAVLRLIRREANELIKPSEP